MSVTDDQIMLKSFDETLAQRVLELGRQTLAIEADAIVALHARLGDDSSFVDAAQLIYAGTGRVVVSGMGKSGHIGRKIAATLSSTGTPAFFMHPGEAAHGDLGMVTANDILIAISNSGESSELLDILPAVKRLGARVIAMTGKPASRLARLADVHLNIAVAKEACTLNLAPTTSTTVTLAMGDALAVALLDVRGFREQDFALSHPGGALGRRLLTHVRDVMRTGDAIPSVGLDVPLVKALLEISQKGMGMTAVVDAAGRPLGVFTDGDLRRVIERMHDFSNVLIRDVMHANPRSVRPEQLAVDAVAVMEEFRINQMLVIDEAGQLVGALHIHDLTRAKVI
ncbi:MAG: KpsF/GutQ family sugar-phosphate isomerase [Massilia sp.]|nr:KpsF/GutQ family sugar-phosphate isomerase [Massilia aurea]MBD8629550.1 KpsF/GutQ family sugar-phosphate isomerase [Oxalobacteraceae sp. CFBP 8753]MBD8633973.1 KpsF/GutQ family sugar-phosphate isomerase [Oxalobacteraceae sp. CFBP 8755]MBD8726102.1 KpsF/GutQ family sugar-phosphate isomerase [Oxalobacteraceae sp. CFBP 13708]